MWTAAEQYVRDAADVHEVIAWAEKEGQGRSVVSVVALGTRSYAVAMIALALFGLIGLLAALRLPTKIERA